MSRRFNPLLLACGLLIGAGINACTTDDDSGEVVAGACQMVIDAKDSIIYVFGGKYVVGFAIPMVKCAPPAALPSSPAPPPLALLTFA